MPKTKQTRKVPALLKKGKGPTTTLKAGQVLKVTILPDKLKLEKQKVVAPSLTAQDLNVNLQMYREKATELLQLSFPGAPLRLSPEGLGDDHELLSGLEAICKTMRRPTVAAPSRTKQR